MRIRVATFLKVQVALYRWLRLVHLCKLTFPCHSETGDNWNIDGNSIGEANGLAMLMGVVPHLYPTSLITSEKGTVAI